MQITTKIVTITLATAVQTIRSKEGLPDGMGAAIYALANAIWPPEPGKSAPTLEETRATWKQQDSTHFVILEEKKAAILAHAMIFRREIETVSGPLVVGALATVCVHPQFRGRGWGAEVVQAAFDYLPELGAKVALFQTGVPLFYEKLGGRLVTNRFVNGDDLNNPFWDSYEMIYPASFDWPDGVIDLRGNGY